MKHFRMCVKKVQKWFEQGNVSEEVNLIGRDDTGYVSSMLRYKNPSGTSQRRYFPLSVLFFIFHFFFHTSPHHPYHYIPTATETNPRPPIFFPHIPYMSRVESITFGSYQTPYELGDIAYMLSSDCN